jgi:hypothetical protein
MSKSAECGLTTAHEAHPGCRGIRLADHPAGPYMPAVIPPDPERDKRVAVRRAVDARRAGEALDRLLATYPPERLRTREDAYVSGYWHGYAASELHHNGHYDVSLPTDGYCGHVGVCPGVAVCVLPDCDVQP